jgi:hypothetical protein
MSTDDLCSQHNKHSNNNCTHEDPSQSSNIYINLNYWPEHFNGLNTLIFLFFFIYRLYNKLRGISLAFAEI